MSVCLRANSEITVVLFSFIKDKHLSVYRLVYRLVYFQYDSRLYVEIIKRILLTMKKLKLIKAAENIS